jgi:hypothetical protein
MHDKKEYCLAFEEKGRPTSHMIEGKDVDNGIKKRNYTAPDDRFHNGVRHCLHYDSLIMQDIHHGRVFIDVVGPAYRFNNFTSAFVQNGRMIFIGTSFVKKYKHRLGDFYTNSKSFSPLSVPCRNLNRFIFLETFFYFDLS